MRPAPRLLRLAVHDGLAVEALVDPVAAEEVVDAEAAVEEVVAISALEDVVTISAFKMVISYSRSDSAEFVVGGVPIKMFPSSGFDLAALAGRVVPARPPAAGFLIRVVTQLPTSPNA